MKCVSCGTNNPSNTVYCVKCGQAMNLTPTQVKAAVKEEVSFERAKSLEGICRGILCFAVVLVIALTLLNRVVYHIPDPDLVSFVTLPPLKVETPPVIEFEEAELPVPDFTVGTYLPPEARVIKKVENELRKEVLSTDNVLLVRDQSLGGALRCRLLRQDDQYYYVVVPMTLAKTKVLKSEVKEIKPVEGAEGGQ